MRNIGAPQEERAPGTQPPREAPDPWPCHPHGCGA